VTNPNFGQPVPPPPALFPAPPAKKGLGTGAIVAIVIGAVIVACCCLGAVVVMFSGNDTKPTSVAATGNLPTNPPASPPASPNAVASVAASPSTQAAAPAGPATVKVGQGIDMKSSRTETKVTVKTVKKAKSNNQFDDAKRGQFVAVNVDIFATKGSTDLGPSNFRLIAADGTVYQSEFLVAGIQPQLDMMTTVEQGQRKTGLVVFDIDPEKFAGLKVQVSDDFSDVQGYWTT
jgi:hypothetical protein